MHTLDEVTEQIARIHLKTEQVEFDLEISRTQKKDTFYEKIAGLVASLESYSLLLQEEIARAHKSNKVLVGESTIEDGEKTIDFDCIGKFESSFTWRTILGFGRLQRYTLEIEGRSHEEIDEWIEPISKYKATLEIIKGQKGEEFLVHTPTWKKPKKRKELVVAICDTYRRASQEGFDLYSRSKEEIEHVLALPLMFSQVPELIVSGAQTLYDELQEENEHHHRLYNGAEMLEVPGIEDIKAHLPSTAYKTLPPARG